MDDQVTHSKDGIWIEESVRREIVSLLKASKGHIEVHPDNGGQHGDIGRIDDVLRVLAR